MTTPSGVPSILSGVQESVPQPSDGSRCQGTNRRGERCQRRAGENGLCIVHGGKLDMKAIGRKGGSARPNTKLRQAASIDDELRESARKVLQRAMDGEAVDAAQLQAAKSLFSYRSDVPAPHERAHPAAGGPKIVSLVDIATVAIEAGMIVAERGGAILVDGHRVTRAPTPLRDGQRESIPSDSPAHATLSSPEADLAELVGDGAPQFDENPDAKLTRRFGAEPDVVSWPQP
jgi:hypothetical protein